MPRAFYCFSRGDRIRTCDPLVPNQMRYRPALLPELIDIVYQYLLTRSRLVIISELSGEGGIRTLGTL